MGKIKGHPPVKLIVGMITSDEKLLNIAEKMLADEFGNIDFHSEILSFDYTDYYEPEMGENLKRKFISFKNLIHPENLAEIKILTNELEKNFLIEGTEKRCINLDPGYLTAAKLVLASTKDHIHRIYLCKGIFAEITLQMQGKTFRPWQWTYPDYRSEEYIKIFNSIRQIYMKQLQDAGISAHSA